MGDTVTGGAFRKAFLEHGRPLAVVVMGLAAVGIVTSEKGPEPSPIGPERPPPDRRTRQGRDLSPSACSAGQAGAVWCRGECIDTSDDQSHCGACGFQCGEGLSCLAGRCVPPSDPLAQARVRSADLVAYSGGTGSYGTWTPLGPARGGRLDGIVANESDQTDLTVAAPGGGVWRTQNNGSSWSQPGTYGLGDFTAWKLERDRISSSRLFLVTPMTVYTTTDSGATWSNIGGYTMPSPLLPSDRAHFVSDPAPFAQMVFDSSTRLLLWGPSCSGLMYSTNGTSFTQLWPFTGGGGEARNCINAIAVDGQSHHVFYSAMTTTSSASPPAIYRSNCAWTSSGPCCTIPGSCWDLVTTGLGNGATTSEIAYTGYSTWMATAVNPIGPSRVHNGSGSPTAWSATSDYPPDASGVGASHDPRPMAYLGQNHLLTGTILAYSSVDLGGNWSEMAPADMHADVRSFYHSSSLGRLWATTDGAESDGSMGNIVRWDVSVGTTPTNATTISTSGSSGLPVWQAYFSAVIQRSSGGPRILMGLQDNHGACSDDGGSSWNNRWGPNPDTFAFAQAPSDPEVGYAKGAGNLVYRIANLSSASSCATLTTRSTTIANTTTGNIWQRSLLAVNTTNADRLYVANFARVARVTYPASGTVATPTLGANITYGGTTAIITTLTTDGGNIYAGTQGGGTYVSSDEGDTWTAWGPSWSAPPRAVLRIAFSSQSGGTSWIASTDGLHRKVGAGSWSLVAGGSGYTVNDVAVDPLCPRRVYIALGFAARTAYHRGGINITEDNGDNWYSTTAGLDLHQAPIADVEVQPGNSRYIYAAVFGQGVWKMDRGSTPTCP